MRIVHLTDIHLDLTEVSQTGFKRCLEVIKSLNPKPELILFGGDLVRDALVDDPETVEKQWQLFSSIVQEYCSIPFVHCLGNHDICGFEKPEIAKQPALKQMGLGKPYYTFSQKGWRFIVLDSVLQKENGEWYEAGLDEAQHRWLKTQLVNFANEPTIILSHIPVLSAAAFLDGDNVKTDSWQVPGAWMHLDAKDLISLFSTHQQVKLCLSGHLHLHDVVQYNGITFACNGAVSGNWWKGSYQQTPPGFGLVDLEADGRFRLEYRQWD